MRGIAIECACEAAYIAVSFSVGLDEPLYNSTKGKTNASRPRRGKGSRGRSSAAPRGAASTIAHLAEHVVATLTSATETDTEAALGIVRATGMRHNAETSESETCFHAAGSADDLERVWVPRLFEAIRNPNLTVECVETERSAALDEMYAFRARTAASDGKLDVHIASVEAPGSWLTRVDEDIHFLENESAARIGAMIGAFIEEYYVPARMHVTVVGSDTGPLLERARRPTRRPTRPRQTEPACLPRAVFPWTSWRAGAVSVIAGSEGDTTRVRFCNSCVVSSDPASVLAAECAAWCVAELLFVELRVRSNAIYSVHASLEMRAVTNEERDGDHDAAIVVATVCTHDKAPLVARAMRDAFGAISPRLVRDWARARRVRIELESRAADAIGERARAVSFAATNDPIARKDRLALIDAVTPDAVRASGAGTYRVYASTADASKPSSVRRAIERALAGP